MEPTWATLTAQSGPLSLESIIHNCVVSTRFLGPDERSIDKPSIFFGPVAVIFFFLRWKFSIKIFFVCYLSALKIVCKLNFAYKSVSLCHFVTLENHCVSSKFKKKLRPWARLIYQFIYNFARVLVHLVLHAASGLLIFFYLKQLFDFEIL